MGIEPTSSAWKAEVLPLNYARMSTLVTRTCRLQCGHLPMGLDRPPCLDTKLCPTMIEFQLPLSGVPGGGGGRIRTSEG